MRSRSGVRHLVIVLGDQLNHDSSAFDDFDPKRDVVWMAEVSEESTHVRSHQVRIAIFLAAMRHFRDGLRRRKFEVEYTELDDSDSSLSGSLREAIERLGPERLVVAEPGEWRVRKALEKVAEETGSEIEFRVDRSFFCSTEEFADWAKGRKSLRMEYFYREMRKRTGILMEDGAPVGGEWNFDERNRESFSGKGPGKLPPPPRFEPDATTRKVLKLVRDRFGDHPGSVDGFAWPVTADDAKAALEDFLKHRLANFGKFQDAMWTDEPVLYHSLLSSALNLKLLAPREVVEAAELAYRRGDAPLPAVEGFIRQILGWREYVRGVYWKYMPEYARRNHLDAQGSLPDFYWTGETDMHCLRQAIGQTLRFGYAHHIQRLMVTGLFALLLGVHPHAVHEWYLAVYVDAVEWVELPNTLGMSQFGDGGVMGSKPYAATGKYIKRMSNYCDGCRFDPDKATGEDACPFTTLYWDFLIRNREQLESVGRMKLQLRNIDRKSAEETEAIRRLAREFRTRWSDRVDSAGVS